MALLTYEGNPKNVAKRLRSDELWMNLPTGNGGEDNQDLVVE